MAKKRIFLLILLIIFSIFIYGCGVDTIDLVPSSIPLEDSIKEIIISKGANYDFLHDELFISKVNELGLSNNFTVGNLDDDTIPELVVFVERDPKNVDDQGKLEVYKFNGQKYELQDSINMNYDNSNHQLVIGRISGNQNGILLSNQVGANATVTYGYILRDGKLSNILNDKKISLISNSAGNEIKDIDNDGILEFSIYTADPEAIEKDIANSAKIIYWYKWNGKDSGKLVQIDRNANDTLRGIAASEAIDPVELSASELLPYLIEHIKDYDKYELTNLITAHINVLAENQSNINLELDRLFNKYQEGNSSDYLFYNYGLTVERLNDIEFLKREKTLQLEPDLKDYLIKHLNLGYKLESSEGIYYYLIDNQRFIDLFGNSITNEYRDYLKIKAKESNQLHQLNGNLMIEKDKLAERIIQIESFMITYPYSEYIDEVGLQYKNYITVFLYGSINTPNYDINNKYSEGSLAVFLETLNNYPDTHFAEIIKTLLDYLLVNQNIITDITKEKINNII